MTSSRRVSVLFALSASPVEKQYLSPITIPSKVLYRSLPHTTWPPAMVTQPEERSDTTSAAQRLEPPSGNTEDAASSFDDGVGDKTQLGTVSVWGKIKQHFRRRWWIYLIAIIILLAILLPLL